MVIDYLNPIVIVGNFIAFFIQYTFAYLVLTPRLKGWKCFLFSLPLFAFGYFLSSAPLLLERTLLRGILPLVFLYAPLLLFYSDTVFLRIVTTILCAVVTLIADLLCSLLWARNLSASYYFVYGMYDSMVALLMVAVAAIWLRLAKQRRGQLAGREWIISMLIPFSQYVSILGWLRYFATVGSTPELIREVRYSVAIVVVLVLLSDYLFFKSIRRTVAAARLETENAALSQQVAAQARYYAALEDQFAANRKIRHDISNHLYTVRALLADGKHAEAEQYALEYLTSVSGASLARLCQEPSVNAFLLYKQEELEKQNVRTDFDITLPADTGISSVDLVTVLGNLLDNAEEACHSIPDSRIRLCIRTESEQIMISEENPYASPLPHAERIPGLSRGVGYTILQSMAEKYGGVFTYEKQDGVYRCALSLKLS